MSHHKKPGNNQSRHHEHTMRRCYLERQCSIHVVECPWRTRHCSLQLHYNLVVAAVTIATNTAIANNHYRLPLTCAAAATHAPPTATVASKDTNALSLSCCPTSLLQCLVENEISRKCEQNSQSSTQSQFLFEHRFWWFSHRVTKSHLF